MTRIVLFFLHGDKGLKDCFRSKLLITKTVFAVNILCKKYFKIIFVSIILHKYTIYYTCVIYHHPKCFLQFIFREFIHYSIFKTYCKISIIKNSEHNFIYLVKAKLITYMIKLYYNNLICRMLVI